MACHEIAALRLGLMSLIGIDDEAERQHELAELGGASTEAGPLRALMESRNLTALQKAYEAALSDLASTVARTKSGDEKLPYLRSLMILTKKVELELASHHETLTRFYRDLEELHDFVHEIYPAKEQ
jgi:hypothetical protein